MKFHPRSMRTHQSSEISNSTISMKLMTLTVRPYILGNVGKSMRYYKQCTKYDSLA